MNSELQTYAREALKSGLTKLPVDWQRMFKLMYGRANGKRSVEDAEALTIEAVVSEIPDTKLDWAMTQVQNSIAKAGGER